MSEQTAAVKTGWLNRALNGIEVVGNKLPDPAVLFGILMVVVWVASWLLSGVSFNEVDPRTGEAILVNNLLQADSLATFMSKMVNTFVTFPPLGVVLVAMLGLGVAEYTGFINAGLRSILSLTPKMLLTPVLVFVGVVSHMAVDAGYVLVIPLGAVIFYAAGRHPLAGIAAAFVGVSGGFSATVLPSSLDPLLSGLTQVSARLSADPAAAEMFISPMNNYYFTTASTVLVVLIGWVLTDKFIEPRLKSTPVDGDPADMPKMDDLKPNERKGLRWASLSMLLSIVVLVLSTLPETSAWRAPAGTELAEGQSNLLVFAAPLMQSIVSIIFIFFLIPGIVYGYVSGTANNHREIIKGMSKAMSGMGYYIVMAFFCAQFIYAFGQSNLGALLAIKGANWLQEMAFPMGFTLIGIVFLSGFVNLVVGSASAKWALIGAVMVPMLMELGVSPDLTQAAYRVGDSSTNIITPLLPYFPLVVVFCQKYVKSTGIGTLIALMLPYSIAMLILWTCFLLGFWALDLPLGIGASYTFPATGQ
ncbi:MULTISPECIES: AbgT family transporter [unclassified Arsukibacterium]|uniref:AbgT family transporter n=1 Tax=unclassified Arsukibacterium TaxID=2635278 RepID=UPI0025BA5D85|nr:MULTISPECIES: AbgT family transporter [unclassified Arsukibacterium]|tara:strand:- start:14107 stop:15699 length:1593 start_codon:yes stop_codon:yes gene_type:complete